MTRVEIRAARGVGVMPGRGQLSAMGNGEVASGKAWVDPWRRR